MLNPSINPENLYSQIKLHIQRIPNFSSVRDILDEDRRWVAKALALVSASGNVVVTAKVSVAASSLRPTPEGFTHFNEIYMGLLVVMEGLELILPASLSGTFIPAGSTFDAHAAFSRVVSQAKKDVLLVDPYLDEKALTEFGQSVPDGVMYRLLGGVGKIRPSLEPAGRKWVHQNGVKRPLEVRLAPEKELHDRAIFIDKEQPWTMSQSLNALATRSHAEILLSMGIAELKIPAYEAIWDAATPMQLT